MHTTFRYLTILALYEGTDSNLRMLFRGCSLKDSPGLLTGTPLETCAQTVRQLLYYIPYIVEFRIPTEARILTSYASGPITGLIQLFTQLVYEAPSGLTADR
jgi:hypothetical protein